MLISSSAPHRLTCCLALLPVVIASSTFERLCILSALALSLTLRACHLSSRRLAAASMLTGLALPCIPWLGVHIIPGVALAILLSGRAISDPRFSIRWLLPMIAYLGGSLLSEGAFALFDSPIVGSFTTSLTNGDLGFASDILRTLATSSGTSFHYLSRVLLLALLVGFFQSNRQIARPWTLGVMWGSAILSLFILAQWLLWPNLNLSNQTVFWTSINRLSGLASDPNSCGVFLGMALILVTVWQAPKLSGLLKASFVSLVVMAGLLSGSRTFILLLILLAGALVARRSRRYLVAATVIALLAVCLVSFVDRFTPLISRIVADQSLPEGARRGLQALSLDRFSTTLFSREIFLSIGREIFYQAPMFGVGPDRFRDYVPLVGGELGLLSGWSDNSNNFYLGLLAELGLVGGIAFFLSVSRRRLLGLEGQIIPPLGVVVILALAMLTGPHIDSPEVLVLVSTLIALTTQEREISVRLKAALTIPFILLGVFASTLRESGVFGWEGDTTHLSRWLSPKAHLIVPCDSAGSGELAQNGASLQMRAPNTPHARSFKVRVSAVNNSTTEFALSPGMAQKINLVCPSGRRKLPVTVSSTPPWAPYREWPASSIDRRVLGVQQSVK